MSFPSELQSDKDSSRAPLGPEFCNFAEFGQNCDARPEPLI